MTLSVERKGRITGSRVGAVLGLSKYQTSADVMRELVREYFGDEPEFVGNEATEHGTLYEEFARVAFERAQGRPVTDAQQFFVHPVHDFLGVSVDGVLDEDELVELKCPYRARYTSITEHPDYEAQVQLQLACAQRSVAWFVIWREDEPLIIERVDANPGWLPMVLPALSAFHQEYLATIADPDLAARHRAAKERTDAEWVRAAADWKAKVELKAQVDEWVDAARHTLLWLASEDGDRGGGVSVSTSERKGAIDYARAVKDHLPGVDLEEYRKPGTTVQTVRAYA